MKCAALGMRTFTKNSSKEDMTDDATTPSSELFMGRALGETSVLFCPYGNKNGNQFQNINFFYASTCECNFLEYRRNCPFTHCIDHLQCKSEATAIQEIWTQCQYPLMAKSSRCIELRWNGQELPDVLNLTGHGDTNLFSLDIKVSLDSDLHNAWGHRGICLLGNLFALFFLVNIPIKRKENDRRLLLTFYVL